MNLAVNITGLDCLVDNGKYLLEFYQLWKKVKVQVFDTPQVVNCFKVESDAALLPSWFNW